ncbi:hypothetical protein [Methylobacterium platani]|uniref:Uncharacterized protein n=2 Tax=Methylobacterium platani TaxID=427683 RepID=A0A179S3Q8_9HYPH|nr:hypothetical protein [Methylobacterium platani]OAS20780.1 hypothetical protein A5481_22055 [Methylobacterium platani]
MATPPRKPQDTATVTAAVLSILSALAGAPAGSPAAGAFVSALRRRGEDLAGLGGVEALREARAAAIAADPAHAETRAGLIDSAWATVPGWTA